MTIYISGTFPALCTLSMNQFILAQGYAKKGMVAVIIGALCNVILDSIFIYIFDMGVGGAAAATVISQILAMLFVLTALRSKTMTLRLKLGGISSDTVKRILIIGIMPFLITVLDNFILILLNIQLRRCGGSMGDTYITCCAIVQSFMVLVNCPGQGITNGCGTLFGFHYGAGSYKKVMSIFKYVFLLCMAYMSVLFVIAQFCPRPFVRLFSTNPSEIALTSDFISKYTLGLFGIAVQFAFVDGLTAMGKVKYAMPLSLFRKLVYIISVVVIPVILPLENIFYTGTVADVIGSLFTLTVFFTLFRKKLKNEMLKS